MSDHNADEAIGVARDYKSIVKEAVASFSELQGQFEESLRLVERVQTENDGLRQELEISRKLNEALRKENRDLKATLDQSAEFGGNAIV